MKFPDFSPFVATFKNAFLAGDVKRASTLFVEAERLAVESAEECIRDIQPHMRQTDADARNLGPLSFDDGEWNVFFWGNKGESDKVWTFNLAKREVLVIDRNTFNAANYGPDALISFAIDGQGKYLPVMVAFTGVRGDNDINVIHDENYKRAMSEILGIELPSGKFISVNFIRGGTKHNVILLSDGRILDLATPLTEQGFPSLDFKQWRHSLYDPQK